MYPSRICIRIRQAIVAQRSNLNAFGVLKPAVAAGQTNEGTSPTVGRRLTISTRTLHHPSVGKYLLYMQVCPIEAEAAYETLKTEAVAGAPHLVTCFAQRRTGRYCPSAAPAAARFRAAIDYGFVAQTAFGIANSWPWHRGKTLISCCMLSHAASGAHTASSNHTGDKWLMLEAAFECGRHVFTFKSTCTPLSLAPSPIRALRRPRQLRQRKNRVIIWWRREGGGRSEVRLDLLHARHSRIRQVHQNARVSQVGRTCFSIRRYRVFLLLRQLASNSDILFTISLILSPTPSTTCSS